MQKFAIQTIGAALALCMAGSAVAAVVPSSHDTTFTGSLGAAFVATAAIPLSMPSAESRGSLTHTASRSATDGASLMASPYAGSNTVVMLIAGVAIMGIVVRRRWTAGH